MRCAIERLELERSAVGDTVATCKDEMEVEVEVNGRHPGANKVCMEVEEDEGEQLVVGVCGLSHKGGLRHRMSMIMASDPKQKYI